MLAPEVDSALMLPRLPRLSWSLLAVLGRRFCQVCPIWDLALLAFFCVVHLAINRVWLQRDILGVVIISDDHAHISGFNHLLTTFEAGGLWSGLSLLSETNSYYSYLAHYPRAMLATLWSDPSLAPRMANGLYLGILLGSLYALGRTLHGRTAGLLAAGLSSLFPILYGGARHIDLDYPSTCLTTLALALALVPGVLRRRSLTILLGIGLAFAILAKAHSVFFLLGPVAYVLVREYRFGRRQGAPHRSLQKGLLLLGLVTLATTALWWMPRLDAMAITLTQHVTGDGMLVKKGDITLLGGLLEFVDDLPLLLGYPGVLLVLPCFIAFSAKSKNPWPILLWVVVPWVLLAILKIRHFRYYMQLVPALGLMAGITLASLPRRIRGVTALLSAVLLLLALIQCTLSRDRCSLMPENPLNMPDDQTLCGRVLIEAQAACPSTYTAVDCGLDMSTHRKDEIARTSQILRRVLGGDRAVLYYPIRLVETALDLQHHLPGLRISPFNWWKRTHARPPASWKRLVLTMGSEAIPRHHPIKRATLGTWNIVPDSKGSVRVEQVIWELNPEETWPPPGLHILE